MELTTFIVSRVIVHQIPKSRLADKADNPVVLSEVPSPLTPRLRNYFRERINASLINGQFLVAHDSDTHSPVPDEVVKFFAEEEDHDFVAMSQAMAHYLHAQQRGNSSAGFLVVIDGTIGSGGDAGKCLVILKLEMDSAIRVEPTSIEGQSTFELEVEEVTLNENATVFKAALFPRCASSFELCGIASDHQRDENQYGQEIAMFFLKFLGCKLALNPGRSTKEYIEVFEQFINNDVDDSERRVKYEMAMTSDLLSNKSTIDPNTFALEYVDPEDQDKYLELFKDESGHVSVITKDTSLVQQRLKTTVLEFEHGVRLSGTPSAVSETVIVEDGQTTIIDNLYRVGRG